MDVSDRIERTGLVAEVVEQRLAHDGRRGDLLDVLQDVNSSEALFTKRSE